MSDKKIRELLEADQSIPAKPRNEWQQILKEIDAEETSSRWKLFIPSFAILVLLVVGGFQGHSYYQTKEDQQLAEFLIDSSYYFNEQSQEEYYTYTTY
jgi:hypothetical protein